jgi:transcriptional regulator with PAS, ATPase and Fis domain
MPPLRERKEDIPALVDHFIEMYVPDNAKQIAHASPETLNLMLKYDWPGNVRELENIMERAIVLADNDAKFITPDLLPKAITK